jgi:hypothetical protein
MTRLACCGLQARNVFGNSLGASDGQGGGGVFIGWGMGVCRMPRIRTPLDGGLQFFATTMEGTVQSFRHANPHCILVLKVAGGSIWHFEGDAPAMVDHAGFGPDTFRPGDRLKLQVQRLKNGRPGGFWSIRMVIMKNGRPFAGHQCATARDSCD